MAAGTEEGHGRAGPGQARPGAERRKAAGGRAGRGCGGMGVAEQPLLPETSLWLAAGRGQQGPPGSSRPTHACPERPVDSSPQPPPRFWPSTPPPAPAAATDAAHKVPPPRLSERRRRQIFSGLLAVGRGAYREMQSRVWGAGGERRKRPVSGAGRRGRSDNQKCEQPERV